MLLNLIRWFRGYVVFEAKGKFPERFMNLCIHRGVFIFDADPIREKGRLTASLLLCDYKRIRPVARRCGVRLRALERCGLPFILSRYRSRKGLLYGAFVFFIIIIFMQSFIWSIEVKGLQNISVTKIEQILREKGVYEGAFKGSKNLHAVERSIMQEVDGISWMSINLIGTKAEVEIKEKDIKPHIIESRVPCNIKAKTDGQIVSMDIKVGSTELPVGSAVKKGQLIVSGIVKTPINSDALTEKFHLVHADARVMAKTGYSHNFLCPKIYKGKVVSDIRERKNLDIFTISFPFAFSNVAGDYTSFPERYRLIFDNTIVPVGVTSEKCSVFEETQFNVDRETAEEILRTDEALYRLFTLKDCEEIKATYNLAQSDEGYVFEVSYKCLEDIALSENIIVN